MTTSLYDVGLHRRCGVQGGKMGLTGRRLHGAKDHCAWVQAGCGFGKEVERRLLLRSTTRLIPGIGPNGRGGRRFEGGNQS